MDLLLGRFADTSLDRMTDAELRRFEDLLQCPDPLLHAWITGGGTHCPEGFSDLVARIRSFHVH